MKGNAAGKPGLTAIVDIGGDDKDQVEPMSMQMDNAPPLDDDSDDKGAGCQTDV